MCESTEYIYMCFVCLCVAENMCECKLVCILLFVDPSVHV